MSLNVRFWPPHPSLRGYISGYHRYHLVRPQPDATFEDVFFPAWANIRFSKGADRWSVQLGRRRFDPVPECAFFGPSSHAGYVSAGNGTLVGIGLTPMGWARLHGGDISLFSDSIAPLEEVFPELASMADDVTEADDPAEVFDQIFAAKLSNTEPENPAHATILSRLIDPSIAKVAELGEGLHLSSRQVARITRTCFGFTPKLLLRRARFLRALSTIRASDHGLWSSAVCNAGYWDSSHFLKDCHLFLGRGLGSFMEMDRPINRESMTLREEVLGAPMQSLYDPSTREIGTKRE